MSRLWSLARARIALLVAVILGASLLVAACGSSKSSGSSSASAAASTTAGTQSTSGSTGTSSSSSSTSKPSGTPFEYLFIVDETGPSKLFAPANILGAQDGAAYLNAHGGINGRPVKVTVVNDNGDPSTATSVLEQYLTSHPKPELVYPGSESAEIAALDPILARQRIYAISNSEGISGTLQNDTKFPDQFTIFTATGEPATAVAAWLKRRGITKVGLLTQEVPYNEGDATAIKAAAPKDGLTIEQATFPTDGVDLTPEVSQLKSDGAQVIDCECLGQAIGYAMTARAKVGWNVPVVANLGASALDITKLAPKADLKNSYELVFREDDSANASLPGTKYLLAHGFTKKAGIAEVSIAANGWDSLMIAANAAKQAGSFDSDAMAKATEDLTGSGRCDPLYIQEKCYVFSAKSHIESAPLSSYPIIPVGPVKNGIVQ